ncbi:MAG: hypothetical protein ABSH01_03500 [Terriglobia bacterium]|jgi:hypothetical protein
MSEDAKKPAARIQPHIERIIKGIHKTLQAKGIHDVKVHSIQFKGALNADQEAVPVAGCVQLPDGTWVCS